VLDDNEFVICLSKGKTFRHNVDVKYKANRKGKPLPDWAKEIKEYLFSNLRGFNVLGLEADDLVGILNHYYDDIKIASIDKDVLKQCPGEHWNYKYSIDKDDEESLIIGEMVHTSVEDANRFLYIQVLAGDSGDNIPGIKGVGVKKAEKILTDDNIYTNALQEYINKFGVIEGSKRFNQTFSLVYIKRKLDELSLSQLKQIIDIPVNEVIDSDNEIGFEFKSKGYRSFTEAELFLNELI